MRAATLSPDQLFSAVKKLQSGQKATDVLEGAFAVAFALMQRSTTVYQLRQKATGSADEVEFGTAQAILLQIAACLSGPRLGRGSWRLDEHRVICIVPWGPRLLAVPLYFGEHSMQVQSRPTM